MALKPDDLSLEETEGDISTGARPDDIPAFSEENPPTGELLKSVSTYRYLALFPPVIAADWPAI